ncbi:hypothetical protein WN944_006151 [Citrus x changshan-huyou]|uniref:Uncharacterized protein n=1 Tax=Citrus x changshan-huyou TaxID=2935761 RepID=A0AAP0ML64_9ROSI
MRSASGRHTWGTQFLSCRKCSMGMEITTRVQTFELELVGCLLTLAGFDDGCMQLAFG